MRRLFVVVAGALALAGCGKPAEKTIEQKTADGGTAKIAVSEGGVKVTTTDASGKTAQMEMGGAQVGEADVGIAFYPGTQPREGGSTRVSSPDGTMYMVMLHSDDAPDKVAGFYRDKLKAQAEGKQFTESSADGSHMLMLADDKTKQLTQVMVAKAESKGSDIQITAHRGVAK
jgi:hypothetical protein